MAVGEGYERQQQHGVALVGAGDAMIPLMRAFKKGLLWGGDKPREKELTG